MLRGRIADCSARIGIVGLGYVGLPTAVALAEGFDVTGIDCDERRVLGVNAGRSHVADVGDARVAELVRIGRLRAVAGIREARDLDVIDVWVPTPLDKSRGPDVSALLSVTEDIRATVRAGQLLILTSTTYDLLNEQSTSVRGSSILVLGMAYKANIGDLRESPALDVIGDSSVEGGRR